MTDHDIPPRNPRATRQQEAQRLAAIHRPSSVVLGLPCDYCADSEPVDGWHILPDPEGIEGVAHVPCARA